MYPFYAAIGLTLAALVTMVALASELVAVRRSVRKGRETAWDATSRPSRPLLKTLRGAGASAPALLLWERCNRPASARGVLPRSAGERGALGRGLRGLLIGGLPALAGLPLEVDH